MGHFKYFVWQADYDEKNPEPIRGPLAVVYTRRPKHADDTLPAVWA